MNCPKCGSGHVVKKGFYYSQTDGYKASQRYICYGCTKQFKITLNEEVRSTKDLPRILLLDIETAPMEVYVWGLYKQYIPHDNIIKDWCMLSWVAKWLYDDEMKSDLVTAEEAIDRNDKRIVQSIHKLLDDADIIVGHNLDRFDDRKIKARFITNGIEPPSPYRTVDTLKVTRREFALPSYKQAYLTKYFGLTNKINVSEFGGFDLWKNCVTGNEEALRTMLHYNKYDVIGLEELYLKVRPYIKNHPNLGVLMDEDTCPNCASEHLEETDSTYFTTANKFPVYRCLNCRTPYIRHKKNSNTLQTNMRSVPK